jgi:pyruvate-ferredoxin/flavodoxin oxidoreductase
MARKFKSMDGNNAAAYVSYAFTEVAGIYPITPSSPHGRLVDQWSAAGQKNIFGTTVKVARCSPRRARPARSTAPWRPAR